MVEPLVSIGVPVKNGGVLIDEALSLLRAQSHRNIEILVSDNNSEDGTRDIVLRHSREDVRVKYFRQNRSLTAGENFRYVLERASGDFFMWAAHDDRWAGNYIEILLQALQSDPQASLAFSEVAIFGDHAQWRSVVPRTYKLGCERPETSYWRRILRREYISPGYLHVYGLIRKVNVASYDWPQIEIGPDRPLLFHLSCRGPFISVPGTQFYCYKNPIKKSAAKRALDNFGRKVAWFPYIRLNWACAKTACLAERLEGRNRNLLFTFLAFQSVDLGRRLRRRLGAYKRRLTLWLTWGRSRG